MAVLGAHRARGHQQRPKQVSPHSMTPVFLTAAGVEVSAPSPMRQLGDRPGSRAAICPAHRPGAREEK